MLEVFIGLLVTKYNAPMKLRLPHPTSGFQSSSRLGCSAAESNSLSLSVCGKPWFPPPAPSKTKIEPVTIGSVCPACHV